MLSANHHAGMQGPGQYVVLTQAQTLLLWKTVGFAAVDFAVCLDAIVPGRVAAAGTRDDVINVASLGRELGQCFGTHPSA